MNLARWRAALVVAFFATGLSMATWVSRTPALRDALGATTADMGLILAGLSVGSVIGITLGGLLVARLGARLVTGLGLSSIVLGVLGVALGAVLADGAVVAVGLALFGYGMGTGEIAQNVEGVELEIAVGRSVVPGLHGCYSLGTFVGGVLGLAANAVHLPVAVHLGSVAALTAAGTAWLVPQLPARLGVTTSDADGPAGPAVGTSRRWPWLDARLLGLGVIILGMALAEGSANDWLPLIVVDGFDLSAATGSIVYSGFGLAMAIGRFGGGRVIDRYGRVPVMRATGVVAALGIGLVSFAPNMWLGGVGVLLWGLGASLGFPVAMSAAGDDPAHAAKRASAVATAGYFSFLVGPPVLGFLGDEIGLRDAILVVMAAALVTTFFAGAVRKPAAAATQEVTTRA